MQLFGHPWSINTRKVLMVLAEKGAAVDLRYVDIPRGAHKRPEHIARHPFAKLPVLDDGEFRLYETAAILRYLDEVLPGLALSPSTPRGRARAAQWDRVHQSYFEPHAHPLIVHRQFSRIIGFTGDEGVMTAGRAGMQLALDVIDTHLRSEPYLAGDQFSLADVTWMPYLDYLVAQGEPVLGERPGVAAWWQRISTRPMWQQVAHTGPQPYDDAATASVIASWSQATWADAPVTS